MAQETTLVNLRSFSCFAFYQVFWVLSFPCAVSALGVFKGILMVSVIFLVNW